MASGALPILADTDVADTLGAGGDLSFDEGGAVPEDTTGDEMFGTARPAPAAHEDEWEDVPAREQPREQPKSTAPAAPAREQVPVPRRAPIREPEVPGRAPDALQPNPEDVAEGRLPAKSTDDDWEDVPPTWGEKLRTGAREFARGVVPNLSAIPAGVAGFGAGSVAGGALAGAASGALLGGGVFDWATVPLGALLGGLTVGGAAGSMQAAGTRAAQDELLEKTGLINRAAEAQENERNPEAATAGAILAGAAGLSPASGANTLMGQIAARGGQAAAQGGMNVGQQAAEGHPVDLREAAAAAAMGAALPGFNRGTARLARLGEGHVGAPPAPAPAPAPAPEPPVPLAVPVGQPYGPESQGYSPATPPNLGVDITGVRSPIGPQATPWQANENAPFVPPEGPRAAANTNTEVQPGVLPPAPGARISGVPNPLGYEAPGEAGNQNIPPPNAGPRATQDNFLRQDNEPPTPAQPAPSDAATQPDFYAQGAPDFNLSGEPYPGPYEPGAPGSPSMPLSGEILPPGAPDPWSTWNQIGARQTAGAIEGPYGPEEGAPSGGPGLPPPGQRSPGGGPPEGPYAQGEIYTGGDRFAANDDGTVTASIPGRPDTTPTYRGPDQEPANDNQLNTPVPGGYPGQSAGALVPTKGARAVNVAPPPRPGLTPKTRALIAKSKAEAATSQPPKVGIATAFENPPPPTSHVTIGNDTSAPFADRNEPGNRDGRGYAKSPTAVENKGAGASATTDDGTGFTPDVAAALNDRLATVRPRFNANDNSTVAGKPGRRTPGMNAGQRLAAQERLPITRGARTPEPANDTRNEPVYSRGTHEREAGEGMHPGRPTNEEMVGGEEFTPIAPRGEPNWAQRGRTIDRSHDTPYLAGSSNDGRKTFIDPRVPERLTVRDKTFDPAKYLNIHETREFEGMQKGEPYEVAHREALKAERAAVEADGIDWDGYQEQMGKIVRVTEHEPGLNISPELYKKPYAHDEANFRKVEAATQHEPAQEQFTGPFHRDIAQRPEDQAAYQQGHRDVRAGIDREWPGDRRFGYAYDRGMNDARTALREAATQNKLAPAAAEPAAKPEHPAITRLRQAREALEQRGAKQALKDLDEGIKTGTVTPEHVEHVARVLEDTRPAWEAAEEAKARGHTAEPRPSEYEEPPEEPARDTRVRTTEGTVAASETAARKKNFAAQTAQHILEEHRGDHTRTPTPGALRDRLSGALKAYEAEMRAAKQNPTIPARGRTPAQQWLHQARLMLRGKIDAARIHTFLADEFNALHPEMRDLSEETSEIEGAIKAPTKKRAGEEAIQNAEIKRLREESGLEENPEHRGWSLIDPEDEDVPGFSHEMTPDEITEMHERHQLAQNLNRADHAAHQEVHGTQRQRFNTDRSKAERLAEIDPTHVGTPEQRRRAIEAISSAADDRSVADLFKNTDGSLNVSKIQNDFIKAKDWLGDVWQRRLGNAIVPARQGKMGSDERALTRVVEAAMGTHISWGGQRDLHAHTLDKAMSRTFTHPDAQWQKDKVGRATYVEDRNYKFMDDFENGRAQPTPMLRAAADFIRKGMKETFDAEKLMGATSEFRDNYIAHMFENDAEAAKFDAWMKDRYGPKWFQKERGYNTIAEARQNGFKLRTNNPMEIYTARMVAGTNFLVKQKILQDMKNYGAAYALEDENPAATIENGWTKINAPNGETVMLAPEVMPMWRNAIDREGDLWKNKGNVGSLFRGWMAVKSVWVPLKLALSGFHLGHVAFIHAVAGNTFGSAFNGKKNDYGVPLDLKGAVGGTKGFVRNVAQIPGYAAHLALQPVAAGASAVLKKLGPDIFKPVTDPLDAFRHLAAGQRIMDAFNDPNFQRSAQDDWHNQLLNEMGLQVTPHALANLRAMQDVAAAVGVRSPKGRVGALTKYATTGPGMLSAPMFHLIQMWKSTQAITAASDLLRQHPEYVNDELLRRAALRELGKNIDDLYSEAFHSTKLWGKAFESIGRGLFLSLDWQSGQISQFGGAVTNQVRSLGAITGALPRRNEIEQAIFNASPKTSMMTRYVAGAMLMSGLMSYALSGETPTGLDYVYPRVGGLNPDGSPRRISLPQWTREGVMFMKHWGAEGGKTMGAFLAAKELLWSKMILAPMVHAVSNRDFYNREMSDPDAPFLTQIGQRAASIWGEAGAISYESANQIEREGGAPWEKALSYAGMPAAPKYIEKSDMQNRIAGAFREGPGAGVKPYATKESDEDKNTLLQQYDAARTRKDFAEATRLRGEIIKKGYMKAANIGKHPAGSGAQYQFERLPRPKQIALIRDMSNDEFRRYVTTNSWVARGGQVERDLLAEWKKTHPSWRG